MCTIRNPDVRRYHVSDLDGFIVQVDEVVPLTQYRELLRKYDRRGKQLERFRLKINRLMRVISDLRSRLAGARSIIAYYRGRP